MATRKQDAKTEGHISQEYYEQMLCHYRNDLEAHIATYGQTGFIVTLSTEPRLGGGCVSFIDFRTITVRALDDVIKEYRTAGWNIEQTTTQTRGQCLKLS
jgi:hypothetical protein